MADVDVVGSGAGVGVDAAVCAAGAFASGY